MDLQSSVDPGTFVTTLTLTATADAADTDYTGFTSVLQFDNFVGFTSANISQTVLLGGVIGGGTTSPNPANIPTDIPTGIFTATGFGPGDLPMGIPTPILQVTVTPVAPVTFPAAFDVSLLNQHPTLGAAISGVNSATLNAAPGGATLGPGITTGSTTVAVPEPSSLIMLGLVACMFGGIRLWRQSN